MKGHEDAKEALRATHQVHLREIILAVGASLKSPTMTKDEARVALLGEIHAFLWGCPGDPGPRRESHPTPAITASPLGQGVNGAGAAAPPAPKPMGPRTREDYDRLVGEGMAAEEAEKEARRLSVERMVAKDALAAEKAREAAE